MYMIHLCLFFKYNKLLQRKKTSFACDSFRYYIIFNCFYIICLYINRHYFALSQQKFSPREKTKKSITAKNVIFLSDCRAPLRVKFNTTIFFYVYTFFTILSNLMFIMPYNIYIKLI